MHPIGKIIIGVILVIAAVYYIYDEPLNELYGLNTRRNIINIIDGIVPILVVLVGLFMIWLEMDELRIEKELKTEEKRVTRKRKR